MFDRIKGKERLAQLDRRIAEAEEQIRAERIRIGVLKAEGYDTGLEQELLSLMLEFMNTIKLHRSLILAKLGPGDNCAVNLGEHPYGEGGSQDPVDDSS